MDEIKAVSESIINDISGNTGFNPKVLLKDYYVTAVLYLLKDVKGIYFKGGTALQKIFLDYSRLSEDADFTIIRETKDVVSEITKILEESGFFVKIEKDKDVEGFTRLVAHYKDVAGKDDIAFIDLNKRARLLRKSQTHRINHFYKGVIPDFSLTTLARDEMVAEKIAAAIGRNKPRDHYDIYRIIKKEMPINMKLAKNKCSQSNVDFSIIKMFNNAKKLKRRWDEDLLPLLAEEVSFQTVMKTLAQHFKLKDEKNKKK